MNMFEVLGSLRLSLLGPSPLTSAAPFPLPFLPFPSVPRLPSLPRLLAFLPFVPPLLTLLACLPSLRPPAKRRALCQCPSWLSRAHRHPPPARESLGVRAALVHSRPGATLSHILGHKLNVANIGPHNACSVHIAPTCCVPGTTWGDVETAPMLVVSGPTSVGMRMTWANLGHSSLTSTEVGPIRAKLGLGSTRSGMARFWPTPSGLGQCGATSTKLARLDVGHICSEPDRFSHETSVTIRWTLRSMRISGHLGGGTMLISERHLTIVAYFK